MQEEGTLQKALFSSNLEDYKNKVIVSVESSAKEIEEVMKPVLDQAADYMMRRASTSLTSRGFNPTVVHVEKTLKRFTNISEIINAMKDFPLFFPQIAGVDNAYKEPLFEENRNIYDSLLGESGLSSFYNKGRQQLNEKRISRSIYKRSKNYTSSYPVLYYLLTKGKDKNLTDTEVARLSKNVNQSLMTCWEILLNRGFPELPTIATKKMNQNTRLDNFPLIETGDGKKFRRIVTPVVNNRKKGEAYAFSLDAYEKFGSPIDLIESIREKLNDKSLSEYIKDSSDIKDYYFETAVDFLKKNPEVKIVIDFLEKSGIPVLDELRKTEDEKDAYAYAFETIIYKYNVHTGNIYNLFNNVIEKTLGRLEKSKYKIRPSQDEIIAMQFIALRDKLKTLDNIKKQDHNRYKTRLLQILPYKVKIPSPRNLNYS